MPHLDRQALLWSLEHITAHGDTDIFPYPFEFEFLRDKKEEIADALAAENTATFRPLSSLDAPRTMTAMKAQAVIISAFRASLPIRNTESEYAGTAFEWSGQSSPGLSPGRQPEPQFAMRRLRTPR